MTLSNLRHNQQGSTIIEMALLLPVAMTLLMGTCELCYEQYIQSVLDGAVAQAGRASSIQNSNQATIDNSVVQQVQAVVPGMTYTITRKSYSTFSNVGQPEPFTDLNGNGKRDPGECYEDINANSTWDADVGINGQGGADDVTIYTVTITYDQIFPLAAFIGGGTTRTQSSHTTLKNQPYQAQVIPTPKTICTP